jgi:hypothetical protein
MPARPMRALSNMPEKPRISVAGLLGVVPSEDRDLH